MVEPPRQPRTTRHLIAALGCAGLLAGCSVVPRSRLDECHKLSKTLQADNAQLKDELLGLKTEFDELAQRHDDDARRLKIKEEQNQHLVASVHAYQEERSQLQAEFDKLRRLVQSSTSPLSATLLDRFETFAKGRPGCDFDPKAGVLTLASDPLFKAGTDQWKPEAQALFASLADVLRDPEGGDIQLLVAGHTDDPPVRRAGMRAAVGHLSLDRATRVRDVLTREGRIDASRVEVAGFEASQPKDDGGDDAAAARNRRIEIHLRRGPSAVTAAPPAGP